MSEENEPVNEGSVSAEEFNNKFTPGGKSYGVITSDGTVEIHLGPGGDLAGQISNNPSKPFSEMVTDAVTSPKPGDPPIEPSNN